MSGQPDIDIRENYIKCLDTELLSILLKDRSSGKNIIWATDIYASKGASYDSADPITVKLITGRFGKIIRPRIDKSQKEQKIRIKDKAEVFTSSWICNEMNNHLCNEWFEKKDMFNTAKDKTWIVNNNKILFTNEKDKTWQDFVKLKVLEISCGEAPFLVSRYDTTTGEWIEVNSRIGALDRKLRVINENCDSEQDWYNWALIAFKSTFGYEWQGDSLLIARENLLFTFIDYYIAKFGMFPIKEYLIEIAKILSWNIWQMDGLKDVIPNSCNPVQKRQMSLFEDEETEPCLGCAKNDNSKHTGIYCKIMNWETKRSIKFFKGEKRMKFDFVIGNPPYQMEDKGTNSQNSVERTSAISVYPFFVTEAKHIANIVSLIIPSRWMTGGKGLDKFRTENLNDCHFRLIHDYEDDKELFPNTDIGGGVMYYVWDNKYSGMVNYFFHNHSGITRTKRYLNTGSNIVIRDYSSSIIVNKIGYSNSFMELVSPRNPFNLNGNVLNNEHNFSQEKNDTNCKFYCWDGNPTIKFLNKELISEKVLLNNFKVFISKTADPPIRFGRENKMILRKPFLGYPNEACSETYLTIGTCKSQEEPLNIIKYIKTKLFRFLVLQKKKTQNVSRAVFEFVPLQSFTEKSDIDWTKSIHDIDLQLYKKYKLSQEEINFIESHVEEMK